MPFFCKKYLLKQQFFLTQHHNYQYGHHQNKNPKTASSPHVMHHNQYLYEGWLKLADVDLLTNARLSLFDWFIVASALTLYLLSAAFLRSCPIKRHFFWHSYDHVIWIAKAKIWCKIERVHKLFIVVSDRINRISFWQIPVNQYSDLKELNQACVFRF